MYNKVLISLMFLSLFNGCGGSSNGSSTTPPIDDNQPLNPHNEPYYQYLWHLDSANSSLNSIDPEADIHIQEAWSVTKGKGVKVAIIDYGFNANHEDIRDNVIVTHNIATGGSDVSAPEIPTDGTHGSVCAGFIASPVNSKGIVGVAPEASLIFIKQDGFSDSNTISAFEYAKEQGAKVISCSWGTGAVSQSVAWEIESLYNAGITVVFASGNSGIDYDYRYTYDESELEWVIGVGGTGENNDVTSYSNYGTNIDILAPSGDTDIGVGLLGINEAIDGDRFDLVNEQYAFGEGTSFSAPIVVGVVALMYSINPNLTPKEVRDILITTADKIGDTEYNESGFDITRRRAYGKINASQAIAKVFN